jgi:hypothetical protein
MKIFNKYLGSFGFVILSLFILVGSNALAATPATINQKTEITARITERKNTLKLQLSTAQNQKIVAKCVDAQKLIKSVTAEDNNNATKRKTVYTNISSRLALVVDGLNKQSVDVTQLKTLQLQFNNAANQYLVDTATYKTTMSDLSEMDCSADPAGFMATITSARQLRVKLANEAGQVASIKNSIIQALATAAQGFNTQKIQENQ